MQAQIVQFQSPHSVLKLQYENDSPSGDHLLARFLRTIVPAHRPQYHRHIVVAINTKFTEIFDAALEHENRWIRLPTFNTARMVMSAANMVLFFGSGLSANQEFCEAALAYPKELFNTAKLLLPLPSLLWPIISRWMKRNPQASNTMVAMITSAVEERRQGLNSQVHGKSDYLQFLIAFDSGSGHLPTQEIVSLILRSWFIAVHETAIVTVHALESLCQDPEYIEQLRHEASSFVSPEESWNLTCGDKAKVPDIDKAPLLDSFLKESSRLDPPNSVTMRRKAQEAVSFEDGTRILPGDMTCVPSQAMMRSNRYHENASTFCAWRFVKDCGHEASPRYQNTTRFTGTELTYPLWGLGKHAWYVL